MIVASTKGVKVRIMKTPTGTVDGMDLRRYMRGHTYDVSPPVAEYLVLNAFAQLEMRQRRTVKVHRKAERRSTR